MSLDSRSQINEDLRYKDMMGMILPQLTIDEFSSKMGEDDHVVVVSFFIKNQQAADDLVNWFETGYDFVLDADRSPGMIKDNRYVVFVELERRSRTGDHIQDLLNDLDTLTDIDPQEWTAKYKDQTWKFNIENYKQHVPLSPLQYRQEKEQDLNKIREAAGLTTVPLYDTDPSIQNLQSQAGIL